MPGLTVECPHTPPHPPQSSTFITDTFSPESQIPEVCLSDVGTANYINVAVGNLNLPALVDTGAAVSCVTKCILKRAGLSNIKRQP